MQARVLFVAAFFAVVLGACSTATSTVPSAGKASAATPPAKGDLYVAVTDANVIRVFAPGKSTAKTVMTANHVTLLAFSSEGILAAACPWTRTTRAQVLLYKPGAVKEYKTIQIPTRETFTAVAFDPKGLLYLATSQDVYVYRIDKSDAPVRILNPKNSVLNLGFDAAGDLAVAGGDGVLLYKPGASAPWGSIDGDSTAAIYDKNSNLAVAQDNASIVRIYPPNSTTSSGQITDGVDHPGDLTIDNKNGFLYVANTDGNTVTVYGSVGKPPVLTIKNEAPARLAIGSGYLFVNSFVSRINEYRIGETKPVVTLPNGSDIAIAP